MNSSKSTKSVDNPDSTPGDKLDDRVKRRQAEMETRSVEAPDDPTVGMGSAGQAGSGSNTGTDSIG